MATAEFTCRRCAGSWVGEKKRGQVPYYCAPCRPLAIRERDRKNDALYVSRHKDKLAERKRAAYAKDPARFRGYMMKTRYGLTIEQYESMLAEQGGGCAICGVTECQTGRSMSIDHDHSCCPTKATSCGKCVRGVLCHSCNGTLLPGYEALPPSLQDSAHINAYLTSVIERDPLLIGLD